MTPTSRFDSDALSEGALDHLARRLRCAPAPDEAQARLEPPLGRAARAALILLLSDAATLRRREGATAEEAAGMASLALAFLPSESAPCRFADLLLSLAAETAEDPALMAAFIDLARPCAVAAGESAATAAALGPAR